MEQLLALDPSVGPDGRLAGSPDTPHSSVLLLRLGLPQLLLSAQALCCQSSLTLDRSWILLVPAARPHSPPAWWALCLSLPTPVGPPRYIAQRVLGDLSALAEVTHPNASQVQNHPAFLMLSLFPQPPPLPVPRVGVHSYWLLLGPVSGIEGVPRVSTCCSPPVDSAPTSLILSCTRAPDKR